jgi:hypothetical protein
LSAGKTCRRDCAIQFPASLNREPYEYSASETQKNPIVHRHANKSLNERVISVMFTPGVLGSLSSLHSLTVVVRVVKHSCPVNVYQLSRVFYALCDVGVHSSTATFGTVPTRLTLAEEGYCGLNRTWSEVDPGSVRVMVKTVTSGFGWSWLSSPEGNAGSEANRTGCRVPNDAPEGP